MTSEIISKANDVQSSPIKATNVTNMSLTTTKSNHQHNSWLLRFFESKHFDMSIAVSYLFNTKEPGVQTYLCNRLFTFPNEDVDFYLPQLLNIYIYACNETSEQLIADMLNSYFRTRCSCQFSGIDFSLRCSWLLDAHINDNARLAASTKESRAKKGLNNAIKLYKLIISERLRPQAASKLSSTFCRTKPYKISMSENDHNDKLAKARELKKELKQQNPETKSLDGLDESSPNNDDEK